METVREDLVRQADVDLFISAYESVRQLNEYSWPKRDSGWFTYHRKKAKNGKYLDDGKCEVCGRDRQYLLIYPHTPKICHDCYQAVRAYSKLLFDPLKFRSKSKLSASECQRIVKYTKTYSKQKLIGLAAVGMWLAYKNAKN